MSKVNGFVQPLQLEVLGLRKQPLHEEIVCLLPPASLMM
jgi:hypothetical protein